ncbi:MAG: iron ABC transporter permease [Myxococcota bacterium]
MPPRRTALVAVSLLMALVAVGAGGLLVGTGSLEDPKFRALFLELRGLRFLAALVAGAGLAGGGVLVQGLFRNPLASPSILGTTAGASLGGQLVLLLQPAGGSAGVGIRAEVLLGLGSVAGALAALVILLVLLQRRADRVTLLLTGFVLSTLLVAVGSFVVSIAQSRHELGRAVVAFTLGGLEGVGRSQLALALPLAGVGLVAAWRWSGPLDALLSGETEAASLGVDVVQARRWIVVWVALLTAAGVALGGNVAFVGLVVPHALRGLVGAEHRTLLPLAALGGGVFLAACDVAVRLAPGSGEVPLGVVTGLVGAPLFLYLLRRTGAG